MQQQPYFNTIAQIAQNSAEFVHPQHPPSADPERYYMSVIQQAEG